MRPLNLLEVLRALRTHWVRLIPWVLLCALAGYGLAFVIPPTYRAQASILPPEEDEMASSLQMARRNLPALGGLGRLSSYFTQADIALAVLRSRTMSEAVIDHFELDQLWGTERRDDAVRRLGESVDIRMAADGTISVAAENRDPKFAAAIANHFLDELDLFNKRNRTFRARRSRMFLEVRVAETDSTLRAAEASLVEYQRKRGSLVLPPEARGALESAASLMGQKAQAELELEMVRRYASPSSEEIARLESRVNELRRQIGSMPSTQAGGAAVLREVYIQQQLLTFLTTQLEESRLREAMDTPTIIVLDSARPPDRPRWPRKSWVMAFGACIGLLAGIADASRLRRSPAAGS